MRRSNFFLLAVILTALLFARSRAGSAPASTVVLYDGALGTTPDEQEFQFITEPSSAAATQSVSGGVTTLDTTPETADKAGYSTARLLNGTVPDLDPNQGFELAFTVQVVTEYHAGSDRNGDDVDDRAGFSVLLLGNDQEGIEIAFWQDEIWAQEGGAARPPAGARFTHAEGVDFDTTAELIAYRLSIYQDQYALATDSTTILVGDVRDYSAEGEPYTIPNSIFLGDNTTSANGKICLAHVSVTTQTGPLPDAVARTTALDPTASAQCPPAHLILLPLVIKP